MARWQGLCGLLTVGLLACGPETDSTLTMPTDVTSGGAVSSPPTPAPAQPAPVEEPPPAVEEGGSVPGEGQPARGSYPRVQSRVPVLELRIKPEDLARLDANPESEEKVPAVVVLDGQSAPARVRYRGASTRDLPQKSFKVELDAGHDLDDRDHFELLASWYDSGKLTEKFAVDLYTALGLPVPSARYVRVSINGQHNGLYLDMEHVGKEYLEARGLEKKAAIYRCGHRNCELTLKSGAHQTDFEKKSQESTGRGDLDALLAWVNRSDDADFEAKLARSVDVDAYLGNLAADMLISNNYIEDARGYWIHETGRDRWQYTPWDLNNALMLHWRTWAPTDPPITDRWPQAFSLYDPMVQKLYEQRVKERPVHRPTWNVLNTRLWDRPALRARMIDKLEAALAGPFSESKALAHIDALWAVVEPELRKDPYVSVEHMVRSRDFLKTYVRQRRAFLLGTLRALRAHGGGDLVIQEVAAGSTGYVELYNRGSAPVSLAGHELTNDLRTLSRFRLPTLTLAPGERLRLLADGSPTKGALHLPFTLSETEGGEVGLFNGNIRSATGVALVYGPVDIVYFGPSSADMAYGRKSPGGEDFARRRR
ncbi:CotH kinase family protein [Melittangium boletus]|uniref:CotH kinase family protein n=1 Tax=Melittangium boletus TaxID=83453 RepID=UPI003DA284ED